MAGQQSVVVDDAYFTIVREDTLAGPIFTGLACRSRITLDDIRSRAGEHGLILSFPAPACPDGGWSELNFVRREVPASNSSQTISAMLS